MDRADLHPSHVMKDNDWGDDRHCQESCETCHLIHCYLCRTGEGLDDDELKEPCIGYSIFKQLEVADEDGVTHKVRKGGTGWVSVRGKRP